MARSKTAARSKTVKAAENKAQDNANDLVKDLVKDVAPDLPVSVKAGDYVRFGSFPQNKKHDKEPIEWLVLEVKGNEALLVSRYGLVCKSYHEERADITWEDCDLRRWLNDDFLKAAFTEEEQSSIRLSEVVNDDNPEFGTRGGNITRDRVFCLSLTEAERYFRNDAERQCRPAELARSQDAWEDVRNGGCFWWLRSPGSLQNRAALVDTAGVSGPNGSFARNDNIVIRPALRLILNQ
jgi:hypothetical protein